MFSPMFSDPMFSLIPATRSEKQQNAKAKVQLFHRVGASVGWQPIL